MIHIHKYIRIRILFNKRKKKSNKLIKEVQLINTMNKKKKMIKMMNVHLKEIHKRIK